MEISERIQNYLFNKMTEEERTLFEKEVEADEELALQLEMQRFELETVDQLEEDTLRTKAKVLKASNGENQEAKIRTIPHQRSRIFTLTLMATAASILLLIVFFVFQNDSLSDSESMALGYELGKTEYSVDQRKGSGDELAFENRYLQILQNRNKTNANQAISYFSTFSSTDTAANLQAQVNLAHAYALNDEFLKAVEQFERLENTPQIDDRKKEEVILLGNSNLQDGEKLLEQIASQNGRYAPVAKTLLSRMDE